MALLPGVSGHYGRRGGGALLLTAASCDLNYAAVRKPSGPAATRNVNHLRLGEELLEHEGSADPRAVRRRPTIPAVTCPEVHKVRQGLLREDLFTVVHDPFMTDTAQLRRHRAAGGDLSRDRRFLPRLRRLLDAVGPARRRKPQGEARSNFDVAQALARRMGLDRRDLHVSPRRIAAKELFKRRHRTCRGRRSGQLFAGEPIHIAHAWNGQPFRTPSGKLEFYSEQLAEAGRLAPARLERGSGEGATPPGGRCAC